mmetsp:Transcript_2108/g.3140  ORF Transcript_2108/g.3140 Transcript_2108/m.3140 type:complete len:265 (-) Transcript_2108:102-896(-)
MSSPSSVGVDDDLSSGQTCISLRTSNREFSARVEEILCVRGEVLVRNNFTNNMLHQVRSDLFVGHFRCVLGRNQDCVYFGWCEKSTVSSVLHSDLRLSIRADPREYALLANLGESVAEFCRKCVSEWHQSVRLISGVAEHDSLVSSSDLHVLLSFMYSRSDLVALLVNLLLDSAGLEIEPLCFIIKSDVFYNPPDHLLVIHSRRRRDLPKCHHQSRLARGLACNLRLRVLFKASIQDRVGHLITELIRMPFIHRLRRKQERHLV